ncbi:signal peptidase complex I [Neocallimastix lanati (nom. inval.)]|jgi:signal peptidase|uniref:Signal peptidase complex catalytic subunit SEC11 n=1 Tax=Neocallimastix californiae TaxID=1754190 RepID=A0A1Y2FFY4_9FUNG|nr:signal peptidase complex I [Neocallimastix sp. JGI-2020a]ORY82831.1 signal peptidase complex I [Neocallimastix californiae]|eukprot:ORY82831.1 signal peptidase complex I [Neocallimastix californiae]
MLIESLFPGKTYREVAHQILSILMVAASAMMMWKGLGVICNSESPIVVVLSESMEPAFSRGDLLFLTYFKNEPMVVGDIVVYKIQGKDIPIVHRVLKIHKDTETGEEYILTKGDNNKIDDRGLYNKDQLWIKKSDIIGKVKGYLPYVGYFTIVMSDNPKLKYALLAVLAILMFNEKDDQNK